jgi:glycosyltransferase involved in cell wall biosynthesis
MRIVMIGQKGLPTRYGGIERHVEELSVRLTTEGHEVLAYVRNWYTPKDIFTYRGVRLVRTPTLHSKHLDAIIHTFTATIHALFQKPDIIHYHGVGPALLSFIPRIFSRKIKVVVTFHCIDRYHQKWGLLAQLFLKLGERAACLFPHQTIAVSKTIQNYCLNEYHTIATYLPNGVSLPEPSGTSSLLQWGVEPGRYVLMVSRLVRHKGAHYLIDAWDLFKKQNPELAKTYKLVIVGDSSFTDEYVKQLKMLASNHSDIIFTGWLSGQALDELYAHTALLVHPSENEGLPITVLQAMSHARPALVSDIPEHQEIVRDAALLFRTANSRSLAEQLATLLNKPALLKETGERNRELVLKEFKWDTITNDINTCYISLTSDTNTHLNKLKIREA